MIEGELVVGAATLGAARRGRVPAYSAAKLEIEPEINRYDFVGTNHVTLGFDRVLHIGLDSLRKEVEASLEKHRAAGHTEQVDSLEAMLGCLDAAGVWHDRYLKALAAQIETSTDAAVRQRYEEIYRNLEHVPEQAPANFKEAVQSLWFLFAFQRLCGNWPGIGRIDQPYLIRRVAEVMKLGYGILAVYNEDLVIESLVKFGYPLEEARKFTNDGCSFCRLTSWMQKR